MIIICIQKTHLKINYELVLDIYDDIVCRIGQEDKKLLLFVAFSLKRIDFYIVFFHCLKIFAKIIVV